MQVIWKTHQHLDENEFLEIVRIPINKIDIFSFENSKTIIALLFKYEGYGKIVCY